MEEKGQDGRATLSRGEHPDHYRMVLIYYAQVRFRWLPFTENKGEDVANYIKKGMIFANVKGKVVELVTLILGRFSIDFRRLL